MIIVVRDDIAFAMYLMEKAPDDGTDGNTEKISGHQSRISHCIPEIVNSRCCCYKFHTPFCKVCQHQDHKRRILKQGSKHLSDRDLCFVIFLSCCFCFNLFIAFRHLEMGKIGYDHQNTQAESCCCKFIFLTDISGKKCCKWKTHIGKQ